MSRRSGMVLAIVLGASIFAGTEAVTESGSQPLVASDFISTPSRPRAEWRELLGRYDDAVRARVVELRLPRRLPRPNRTIALDLFDDVQFTAYTQRLEPHGARGFSWFGSIHEDPHGYVTLTYLDGRVAGSATFKGRYYTVANLGENAYALLEYPSQPDHSCGNGPGPLQTREGDRR